MFQLNILKAATKYLKNIKKIKSAEIGDIKPLIVVSSN